MGANPGRVRSSRMTIVAAAFVVAAGFIAYANGFTDRFTGLDARESIRDNPHIRHLWPLSEAMSLSLVDETLAADPGSKGGSVVRRPILSLTFALNHYFLGPAPWGFHVINLVIHLASGLLLFGLLRRTLELEPFRSNYGDRSLGIALAISVIWTVHPVQTESVTYIVQRAESLMGFFYLLTLYCAVRGFTDSTRASSWYVGAVLACSLGMGTKETMCTAPVMVLLYDGTFVSPSVRAALTRRRLLYGALAMTWTILVILIASTWHDATRDFSEGRNMAYAVAQLRAVFHYLRLAVWPHPLHLYVNTSLYQYQVGVTPVLAYVAAGVAVFLLLVATGWGLLRRHWLGFLGAWFFLILAPSSSIVAATDTVQEHRIYLSLAAVITLGVVFVDALVHRVMAPALAPVAVRRAEVALLAALVGVLIVVTARRNLAYRSEFAPIYPADRFEALAILARHEVATGRLQNATAAFEELSAFMPIQAPPGTPQSPTASGVSSPANPWAKVHFDFANLLCREGHFAMAQQHFAQAIRADPRLGAARNNLGALQVVDGNVDAGRTALQETIRINPTLPQPHRTLGLIYLRDGNASLARTHLERALTLAPGFEGVRQDLAWLDGMQRNGPHVETFDLVPQPPYCFTDAPISLQPVPPGTPRRTRSP